MIGNQTFFFFQWYLLLLLFNIIFFPHFRKENSKTKLKYVFTPMHGVGQRFAELAFEAFNLPQFISVKEQVISLWVDVFMPVFHVVFCMSFLLTIS